MELAHKQILKSFLESQLAIEKVVLKEARGHFKLDNSFLHDTIHITIMKIKEIERQIRKLNK